MGFLWLTVSSTATQPALVQLAAWCVGLVVCRVLVFAGTKRGKVIPGNLGTQQLRSRNAHRLASGLLGKCGSSFGCVSVFVTLLDRRERKPNEGKPSIARGMPYLMHSLERFGYIAVGY